jgi:hypothetical protein
MLAVFLASDDPRTSWSFQVSLLWDLPPDTPPPSSRSPSPPSTPESGSFTSRGLPPLFDDVPLDTWWSSDDVVFNGTLTTPSCQGGCMIGTPLPRSSPNPCNVSGVSRGRIPITVHLILLHEFEPLWTRSTREV